METGKYDLNAQRICTADSRRDAWRGCGAANNPNSRSGSAIPRARKLYG